MRLAEPIKGFAIFLGFCVLLLVHVLLTFSGFYGNDDINYAGYAAQLVNNYTLLLEQLVTF